jgi:toxin YhaV
MTKIEPLRVNGWTIIAHDLFLDQIEAMISAVGRDRDQRPNDYKTRAAAKMLAAAARLAFHDIPRDSASDKYRQGNTLGADYRHWRRAKFYQQFRLFFRYREAEKIIVYAWINDDDTRRAYGSKTDAYAVFKKMLDAGNPPDDWAALMAACDEDASKRLAHAATAAGALFKS